VDTVTIATKTLPSAESKTLLKNVKSCGLSREAIKSDIGERTHAWHDWHPCFLLLRHLRNLYPSFSLNMTSAVGSGFVAMVTVYTPLPQNS
jgi:PP-loop superfamily ATP-utilizing enzyme